jgi:hypothetical protein
MKTARKIAVELATQIDHNLNLASGDRDYLSDVIERAIVEAQRERLARIESARDQAQAAAAMRPSTGIARSTTARPCTCGCAINNGDRAS